MFLGVLRMHHPTLPRDPRTLMRTPRDYPKKYIDSGVYVHFGIEKALLRHLSLPGNDDYTSAQLQLHIDRASIVDEHTVRRPGSRNLCAYHKLLNAHEPLPPTAPQYAVIDVARTATYVDARAVERETVQQSSDTGSDCTSRLTNFNTRYIERKRVPVCFSSDDEYDSKKKGTGRQELSVYPVPPIPALPQPIMPNPPRRSPIPGPSTMLSADPVELPPLLVPEATAIS
ncbi:uncharacterized protein DEA37_0003470 [Paragonimus westermani]|uniref:Uncharacterized protein n=1 Tax=Paragonimus westermani TaxID=34504 RepID=A0A5J4N5W1_9TREM|nr:uncharacterized protein DEA37_0003470 [Paragonimus westermani]